MHYICKQNKLITQFSICNLLWMLSLYKDWVELDGIVDEKMENGKWKMNYGFSDCLSFDLCYEMDELCCFVFEKETGRGRSLR